MAKILVFLLFISSSVFAQHQSVRLQVLGSGGPEMGDKRASSGYLIWVNGKAKVLIDFGGGASLRFEQVGAKIEDLDVVLLSHLHVDHTADIPALIKAAFFTEAYGDLAVFGPEGNKIMPDTQTFINRLFQYDTGAWQYLRDNLDGNGALHLNVHNIAFTNQVKTVYEKEGIKVEAISVHHGPIPAIAYKVTVNNKSITFTGDMSGRLHNVEKLALNSDILVAHNAVPKGATGVAAFLHMTPNIIGEIAQKAHVKKLVLSHRMLRTLGKEAQTMSEINKHYKGETVFSEDKSLYYLPSN